MKRSLVSVGVLLFTMASAARAQSTAASLPDLGTCERLQAPAGSTLTFHVYADGVQIYRWSGSSWDFVAPSAVLFADPVYQSTVGIHYAGPTWQSVSGSKVVGVVSDRCTPDANSIAWLLLGVVSAQGPGVFEGVTAIQRVNTVGGKAPSYSGTFMGEIVNVPYKAEYFFYR